MKNRERGFSMMEMIIVIGIIAILATLITPLALNYITQKRYDVCNDELKIIKEAIVGKAELIEGGTRSSFGFVGDLGQLPETLEQLIEQNVPTFTPLPSWGKDPTSSIWFGWRGPYVSETKDPWGNDYNYTNNWPGGTPLFQNLSPIIFQIWSSGQDGISGNTDDVSISIRADEAFSMISGNTLDECKSGAAFTGIQVFYPNGSSIVSATHLPTTVDAPHYNIQTAIPIGIRTISYQPVGYANIISKLVYINNGPLTIINLQNPNPCN